MMSSGVLAFYLSESEDPELWKAVAQLAQDERTAVFKKALSHMILTDADASAVSISQDHMGSLAPGRLFSPAESVAPAQKTYESSEGAAGLEQENRPKEEGAYKEKAAAQSGRFELLDKPKGGRHTLTPSFSRAQTPALMDETQMRIKQLFHESAASQSGSDTGEQLDDMQYRDRRQTDRRQMAAAVWQPDLEDVALNDVFSEEGVPKDSLRGLDFLLKNVIGEEDDETVMQAIRRKRAIQGR